jgi:hypothetical protein
MANPPRLTVSDTAPDLEVTLYNANTRQDLTGCTAILKLRLEGTQTTAQYPAVISATPEDGVLVTNRGYLSAVAPGDYAAEWLVTFQNGAVGTWPTPGKQNILFIARRT